MIQVSPAAGWLRAPLVVLSDRRPVPGIPRTGLESAIEWALREHDGVWLARHSGSERALADAELGSGTGEWSVLGVLGGAAAQPRSPDGWTAYVQANTS